MSQPNLVETDADEEIQQLVTETDRAVLLTWAADVAERVLPYFEQEYPDDERPRLAIEGARDFVDQPFDMNQCRTLSLDAHEAAREAQLVPEACFAARSAGHAVGTAHVDEHATGAVTYALTAIREVNDDSDGVKSIHKEQDWQLNHLIDLKQERKQ